MSRPSWSRPKMRASSAIGRLLAVVLPTFRLVDCRCQGPTSPRSDLRDIPPGAWRRGLRGGRVPHSAGASRRAVRAPDRRQHRQRDPVVRRHRRDAAPGRAARLRARRAAAAPGGPGLPRPGARRGPPRPRRSCARRCPTPGCGRSPPRRPGHTDVDWRDGDALLFGPEPTGLPETALAHPRVTDQVRIPMLPGHRSMNLSNAAAVATHEAWRQPGLPRRALPARRAAGRPQPGAVGSVRRSRPRLASSSLATRRSVSSRTTAGIGGWRRLARTCHAQVSATELADRPHRHGELAGPRGVDLPHGVRDVAGQHERQVGPGLDARGAHLGVVQVDELRGRSRPVDRTASAHASSVSPKVHMPSGPVALSGPMTSSSAAVTIQLARSRTSITAIGWLRAAGTPTHSSVAIRCSHVVIRWVSSPGPMMMPARTASRRLPTAARRMRSLSAFIGPYWVRSSSVVGELVLLALDRPRWPVAVGRDARDVDVVRHALEHRRGGDRALHGEAASSRSPSRWCRGTASWRFASDTTSSRSARTQVVPGGGSPW